MSTPDSRDVARPAQLRGPGISRTAVALAMVLSLESLAVLALVGARGGLGGRLTGWVGQGGLAQADDSEYETRLDPQVGAVAPAWRATTVRGRPIQQRELLGRPAAMLFIGPCGSCALARVRQWEGLARRSPDSALLVITPSTAADAARFSARLSGAVRVVCDTGGQMALAYNAAWRPRAYAVDARGRLTYCQPERDTSDAALASIGRMLNGRRAEEVTQ